MQIYCSLARFSGEDKKVVVFLSFKCITMELQVIREKIYEIRGQKVMLDFDLAGLYGVETKVFNQAVKRNINRFPEDFMFQLTAEEWNSSQIVMSLDTDAEIVDSQRDGNWSQNVTSSGAASEKMNLKKHRGNTMYSSIASMTPSRIYWMKKWPKKSGRIGIG
jgi:hypothetical protein